MDQFTESIRDLPPADKLLLVERIWDDLAGEGNFVPLPDWAVAEAKRRRDDMLAAPNLGSTHSEVWRRINDLRHG